MTNYEQSTLDDIGEDVKKLHRLLVKEDEIPLNNSLLEEKSINFKTGYKTEFERNRIIFGAPGTGKSYRLKKDCEELMNDTSGTYERVTFHPDYTYSHL